MEVGDTYMRGCFVSGTCSQKNLTYHACFLHASRRIVAVTDCLHRWSSGMDETYKLERMCAICIDEL